MAVNRKAGVPLIVVGSLLMFINLLAIYTNFASGIFLFVIGMLFVSIGSYLINEDKSMRNAAIAFMVISVFIIVYSTYRRISYHIAVRKFANLPK
jgi:hypothetical protein